MPNILNYIQWRGDLSFEKDQLNHVDALIFSRISYLPFENIPNKISDNGIKLSKACKMLTQQENYREKLLWKEDDNLINYCAESIRFGDVKLMCCTNIINEEEKEQFSAIVLMLKPGHYFIVFRGTDNSFVGWHEDFNMSCRFPVGSQQRAVEFIEDTAQRLRGDFYVGGHSKGGNLAVYGSAFCKDRVRKRIIAVYNHDGPGFDSKTVNMKSFDVIKDKIHTYVPQSFVVGMMFEHREDYTIIKSSQKGIMQHDIYSWQLIGKELICLSSRTNSSLFFDKTFTEFADNMAVDQRAAFIDALFSLTDNLEEKNFDDLSQNLIKNSVAIFKNLKNIDSKTRDIIIRSIMEFLRCAKNNFSEIYIKERASDKKSSCLPRNELGI